MTSYTLEDDVGEQRNGCGVNDSEPLDPLFRTITSAVRGKNVSIGGIQVAIHFLKELLRPPGICIRQRTALRDIIYADMVQFANLCCHRCLYLTQRVEPLYHGIEHRKQMRIAIKALYILLSAVFSTYFNNFISIK